MEEQEKQQQEQQLQQQQMQNQQMQQQQFQEREMEQWSDVKNNSGKATTAIIVFLLLVILAFGGFIFIKKDVLFSKDATKEDKKTADETTLEDENVTFTESELEKYVNYIKPVSTSPSAKLYDISSINADSLSTREKIEYVGAKLYSKVNSTSDAEYNILAEDDVKNLIEEVYGPNTYERTTFNLGCEDYTFRENEGKYYSHTGCGGTSATFDQNIVIDYTATKSKLEITTAYAIYSGETKKIYKDFNQQDVVDEYAGGETNETNNYLSQYVKDNKDKLNHIIYTFESEDGKNYYFKEFKNTK